MLINIIIKLTSNLICDVITLSFRYEYVSTLIIIDAYFNLYNWKIYLKCT